MPQVSAAMSRHRQFIIYRAEPIADRPGKTNKLPIDWRSGRVCSAHDPAVWLSHPEAEQHAAAWGQGHGVGFVFTEGCGLWFLDIDECLDAGGWSPLAQQLLGALAGCAVEVSLSGRGLHVFGSGTLPAHACKNTALHLELYHTERFVALTGTSLMGDAATVPRPEVLQWLVGSYFAGAAIDNSVNSDWATEPVPEWSGPTDDDELIARMLRAPASAAAAFGGGVTVRDLWTANAEALGRKWPSASGDEFDRSSADAALASHLAYYTGNNHERMRRLMQRSALVRDKWEREGYVADTVQRMAGRTTKWLQDRPPATVPPGATAPAVDGSFLAAAGGAIPATLVNVQAALRSAESGVQLAYDAFRDRIVLGGPGAWRLLTDVDYVTLRHAFEQRGFKPVAADLMRDAVLAVAMGNTIDTATEWAGALQWDGVPRVADSLVRYFGAAPSPYTTAVSLYLWTALAGRAMDPGCQADMALILVGPQGARKSTAVRNLAQSVDLCGSVDLLKVDDDDTARKLRGKLVIELGELRGLKGRDSETIKDWVTRRIEAWTPKYREFETTFPRRCVLVGSSNRDDLLTDTTGNRRWLPVRTGNHIDAEGVAADREQLWAEAVAIWRQHGIAWQQAEALARAEHEQFEEVDEWEGAIADALAKPVAAKPGEVPSPIPLGSRPFQMSDVAAASLGLSLRGVGGSDERRIGAILRKLGYARGKLTINGKQIRGWVLRA